MIIKRMSKDVIARDLAMEQAAEADAAEDQFYGSVGQKIIDVLPGESEQILSDLFKIQSGAPPTTVADLGRAFVAAMDSIDDAIESGMLDADMDLDEQQFETEEDAVLAFDRLSKLIASKPTIFKVTGARPPKAKPTYEMDEPKAKPTYDRDYFAARMKA